LQFKKFLGPRALFQSKTLDFSCRPDVHIRAAAGRTNEATREDGHGHLVE
jgi:hypothetical protein